MARGDEAIVTGRRTYVELFLVSVFLLFLEILLIRWISTEVRVFAYLKNLALVACFLGMGVGCILREKPGPALVTTFPALAALVAAILVPKAFGYDVYQQISCYLGDFGEMPLWGWDAGESARVLTRFGSLVVLGAVFASVSYLFVPGGRAMARLFDRCPSRNGAYSVNLAGSLVGTWLFGAISFLALPPLVWFGLAVLLGILVLPRWRARLIGLVSGAILLSLLAFLPRPSGLSLWSPYQKLRVRPLTVQSPAGRTVPGGHLLTVNDTFYQRVVNLDERYIQEHLDLWPEAVDSDYIGYNLIYRVHPGARSVLVVGAGTGNDVAAALRNGAAHVDAVEIDPLIVEIGRRVHAERPYSDPRVSVVIDDARSFFKKAGRRYDLIVFGALDSHTLTSALTNVRIDNYVYTVESFREARELLTDDGVLCLTFALERDFIGSRLAGMLRAAFGVDPVVFLGREIELLGGAGGGPTFIVDRAGRIHERVRADPKVASLVEERRLALTGHVPLARDDWPYLYLARRTIPTLYIIALGVLVAMTSVAVRPFFDDFRRIDPHFFCLGAAFLLVEMQSISKMALLFGTTWFVTSVVISAVLVMILLANLTAARLRIRSLLPVYAALFLALVLNLAFPFRHLLALGALPRGVIAGFVMGLPIFFAGLVFILTFAREEHPGGALGANLLGAIAGGACECLSFIIGLNALGLVAMLFYACSLGYLFRHGRCRLV